MNTKRVTKPIFVLVVAIILAITLGFFYSFNSNSKAYADTVNGPKVSGTGDVNLTGSGITWDKWGYENGGEFAKPDYAKYDKDRLEYYDSSLTKCSNAHKRNTDIVTYLQVPVGATTVALETGTEQWYDCGVGDLVMYSKWEISVGTASIDANGKVTSFTATSSVYSGNQYICKHGGYGGRNTDNFNVPVQGGKYVRVSLKNWFTGSGGVNNFRMAVYIDKLIATYDDQGATPTAPTNVTSNVQPIVGDWYDRDVTLTATGSTDYDGVQKYQYSKDKGVTWIDCTGTDKNQVVITESCPNYYQFRAVDVDGNGAVYEYNKYIQIDKVAPVIGNFTGQDTPKKDGSEIYFTITETGSGIENKKCEFNGTQLSISLKAGTYYFVAKTNGVYTITVTDIAGNKSSQSVTVTGIDNDAPIISEITGTDNVSLFNGKTVSFRITDKNGIGSVSDEEGLISGDNGVYTITVHKNGKHAIRFTDMLGNEGGYELNITNCYFGTITEGVDVTITGLTKEGYIAENGVITVKVISSSFGQKLVKPTVNNATVTEKYNYGLEAEYTVAFNGDVDYTQTVNAKYEAMQVTVQINGTMQSFGFNSVQTFTADGPKVNQVFVGWFNKNGILVSTDKVISVTISSANSYTAKYINKEETMITFLNLAGKVIDIKGVQLYGEKLEDYLARQTDVKAPTNAYMTFAGWVILQNNDGTVVVKATYNRTADQFDVTVNGVTTKHGYNEKVVLTGDETTKGWSINGQTVSNSKEYTFFVINNVVIDKITDTSKVETEARQIAVSKTGNVFVITGLFTTGKKYDEVGFVFADGNIKDEYITFNNTLITALPIYTITNTKQIVANVSVSAFSSKKVRIYTRVGDVFSYSNVVTLS